MMYVCHLYSSVLFGQWGFGKRMTEVCTTNSLFVPHFIAVNVNKITGFLSRNHCNSIESTETN